MLSLTGLEYPSEKTFDELISLLRQHFVPKINQSSERAKFCRIFQESGESITEYSIRLQSAAKNCKFGEYLEKAELNTNLAKLKRWALEDHLKDQFVIGVKSDKIRQVLYGFY